VVEVPVALAIVLGAWTRPLALLVALYTLGTGLIGHHFWTMEGAARYGNAINFYKNISIIGGFLLLYVTGAGRYSVDARLGRPNTPPPR
jgi:putative oxidoreductase